MGIGRILPIGRVLPGELDGTLDPRDYGFGVIQGEQPSEAEVAERIGRFYAAAKDRTGVVIPQLERYLGAVAAEG